jgi:hypothetical protein
MGPSTPLNQRPLPGFSVGAAKSPVKVPEALIHSCDSLSDAITLCVHLSKLPHRQIALSLGIDKGHWARIMQGQANFPENKIRPLQFICGNWAPLQYQNWEAGFEMYEDPKAKRREELLRELASLDQGPSTVVHKEQARAA